MDLSIVIPAFNEEHYLGYCCDSIFKVLSDYDLSYEIFVVNNGSTDDTNAVASSYPEVTVIDISRTSVAQARNIGAEYARGRLLAFIDADVVLESEWGFRINFLCQYNSEPIVTGFQYGIRKEASWVERYWFGNMESSHINGGNLIASRDAFDEIGGFDPKLKTGEDVGFCNRARNNPRIRFELDPKLKSIHLGYPKNIKNFMKREYWHGEGDFRSFQSFCESKIALVAMSYGAAHLLMLGFLIKGEYKGVLRTYVIIFSI